MTMVLWYPEAQRRFADEHEWLADDKSVNHVEPLVSVCIPTYQHGAFIRECLDGVLAQATSFPFEVIIGEDESTDGTREICLEYAARHPDKIRLFLRSRSRSVYSEGESTQYFNGLWCRQSARGKYLALCEGDDCWTDPAKLQTQIDLLEASPEVTLCGHSVLKGSARNAGDVARHPKRSRPLMNTLTDILPENWIPTCSMVFRRDALPRDVPVWAQRVPFADWPMQVMAAQRGAIAFIDAVMGFYRIHPGGMWSGRDRLSRKEQILAFYTAVKGEVPRARYRIANAFLRRAIADHCLDLCSASQESGHHGRALRLAWTALRNDPATVFARLTRY
jgi:glycosyltransferase involved in cell wall biosynthesis